MNQPSVLKPMRPTVLLSPILAMPTVRVVNTSGAMIILMRRRKISVSIKAGMSVRRLALMIMQPPGSRAPSEHHSITERAPQRPSSN